MPDGALSAFAGEGRALLIVAAPAEARALLAALGGRGEDADLAWRLTPLGDRIDLAVSGVGKANAAGCAAHVFDRGRHGCVLSVGVCGSLGSEGPPIGAVVLATGSVYADEGLETPEGFRHVGQMGFSPCEGAEAVGCPGAPADADLLRALRPLATAAGPIATVSTCAGVDARAAEVVRRTGAIAEAMEGAAVGVTLMRLARATGTAPARFGEVRVVSNTTGDRDRQRWDLPAALAGLGRLARTL